MGNSKYSSLIISFIATTIISILLLWVIATRIYYIITVEKHTKEFIVELNKQGYDLAYEEFSKSYIPFTNPISFKNIKIYNLCDDMKVEISFENVKISKPIFNFSIENINFQGNKEIVLGDEKHELDINRMLIKHKDSNDFIMADVSVNNLIKFGHINIKQQEDRYEFDMQDIALNDKIEIPLLRHIEKLNLQIKLNNNFSHINSNKIDIDKFIIRWEPLLLVGKGNISFTPEENITFRTSTTSKGLLETLEMLNEKSMIDETGFDIVNMMLSTQAYRLNPEDKYSTITTSINMINNQILIGNVSIYEFSKD